MKPYLRIERLHRVNNRIYRAKRAASLLLAIIGVLAVTGKTVVSTHQASTSVSIPGDLNAPRSGHTATLLTTGKVIIVGGQTGLSTAGVSGEELFDPGTGTWSVTGRSQDRISHTATLLTDGQLLVVGGWDFADLIIDSAELYDPATGKWSATGKVTTARTDHTATLLPDGKVLVAGGAGRDFNSAELYDPTTGTWSETGNLNNPHSSHTATLLQNGKVLVTQGAGGAELYNPETGTWSETGSLNTPRFAHSATLLPSGKVLVAGGRSFGNAGMTESAELYDPDTETWSKTGNLHSPRAEFNTVDILVADSATLLPNGKVLLVAGGSTAELYDPETGTWSLTAGLNAPRVAHTATLLPDGRVLVAGGISSTRLIDRWLILNSSEIYDPETETWLGPVVPVITGTSIVGKRLILFGENFGTDSVILRNGIELQSKKSGDTRKLVAKKGAKKIKPGDKLQVLNPSGALSKEFVFAGS